MASNFTENFGLNQWERSDKVLMEDFNADNAKIDAALKAVEGKIPQVAASWFRGDGEPMQFISTGFLPNVVIVCCNSRFLGSSKSVYGGLAVINGPVALTYNSITYPAVTITDNGFRVYEVSTADPDIAVHCNLKNVVYNYLAVAL